MSQEESKKNQEKTNTQDSLDPSFQWLMKHRKNILYFFVALFALAIIAFKLTTGKTSKAESSYLTAENYFSLLQNSLRGEPNPNVRINTLDNLKKITDQYPELRSRYDGFIAQLLLIQEKTEEALPLAERTLSRIAKDQLPPYSDFTSTTLLISQGQYKEALTQALTLKDLMIQQTVDLPQNPKVTDFGSLLFAYNLFRIAMLQQHIGNAEQELEAWEEWKYYAQTNGEKTFVSKSIDPEAFSRLNQQVGEGDFTLTDYIKEREQHLKQKVNVKNNA